MIKHILPKFLTTLIAISCVFCPNKNIFAQDSHKDQANEYREAGLEKQRMGNLNEAMNLYQKAIVIDPSSAVAYNDLGVVYEALGFSERAEESYLTALKIDPSYPSVYTNLALFYEGKRNLEKAEFYWAKRSQIGLSDDPWTQKAASRLKDIRMVTSKSPLSDQREEQVLGFMKEVSANKDLMNRGEAFLSKVHFQKAKDSFKKGDMATAIKEALDAEYLDQDNPEIEAFIEQAELRALSK